MFLKELVVVLCAVAGALAACTCQKQTTCGQLKNAADVVEARVVSVAHDWAKRELQYKIRVKRSFKGLAEGSDAKVVVPMDADKCGLPLLKQGDLITTALGKKGDDPKGVFHLNSCGFFYMGRAVPRPEKKLLKAMNGENSLSFCGCYTTSGLWVASGWTGFDAGYQKVCQCVEGNYNCDLPSAAQICVANPAKCGNIAPCSISKCKVPGQKRCVDDYCNGCKAKWFTEFNVEITAMCEALN